MRRIGMILLSAVAVMCWGATPIAVAGGAPSSSAAPDQMPALQAAAARGAEMKALQAASGVTASQAEADLDLQHRGSRVNIVDQLRGALAGDFAGVWFDNATAEFVVSVATAGKGKSAQAKSRGIVAEEFAASALENHVRVVEVKFSMEELEAAQAAIDEDLAGFFEVHAVQTALDPSVNAIMVRVPTNLTRDALAEIEAVVGRSNVPVRIVELPESRFSMAPASCNVTQRSCDLPFRGGEIIYQTRSLDPNDLAGEACTAAFRANGTDGKKYVLTAGHCTLDGSNNRIWHFMSQSVSESTQNHIIGTVSQWHYPGKDWAKIDATGYWPDTPPWPTQLAFWPTSETGLPGALEYPITGESKSFRGQTLCHIGANTGTSCGEVIAENVSVEYVDGTKLNSMFEVTGRNLCLGGGDSGGPFFANNIALGILSGGGPDECAGQTWIFFSDIMAAKTDLNVNIAGPGAPEAITGGASNVQARQATVTGQVNPHGLATTYRFEYGIGNYSSSTATTSAGSGQGFGSVSASINGLKPVTTYQYRISASNSLNTVYGSRGEFSTPPLYQIAVTPSGTSWTGVLWGGTDGNLYDTVAPAGEWYSFSPTWSHKGIPVGVRPISGPTIVPASAGWDGMLWTGSDGNIYDTQARSDWESWSPTWSRAGIPSGVKPVSRPAITPSGAGWSGLLWVGSDGNIYDTQPESTGWGSFSPTWFHKGIPSGVKPVGDLAVIPSGTSWDGVLWTGSDGNIYDTQARNGEWESWSPTWRRWGIPDGVKAISNPAVSRSGGGWDGVVWFGSDGNIYKTQPESNGEWESFSPTWFHVGIPSGVKPQPGTNPVMLPLSAGANRILWVGTDGNLYVTQPASGGGWESWSPTWSRKGLPPGVRPAADPMIVPKGSGSGVAGFMWPASDGNVYMTQAPSGEWESWSPTWSRKGIPSGVTLAP